MAEHEIALKRLQIAGSDFGIGEQPEAGVHAVDDGAARHVIGDDFRPAIDFRIGIQRQFQVLRRLIDSAKIGKRQRFADSHGMSPTEGRFRCWARAVSSAIS